MLFTTILTAAFASMVSAGAVHFVNQDGIERCIYFTPQSGMESIAPLTIAGHKSMAQQFPAGWTGNWYSVSKGKDNTPGMLGEVAFDGYAGSTYFDVSAIVNPNDNEGVKMIFPKNLNHPVSGCQKFPCANAYNKPNDVETQSAATDELVCLLGTHTKRNNTHAARHSKKHAATKLKL